MFNLYFGQVCSQFVATPATPLPFTVLYAATSASCGRRVFGVNVAGVKVEPSFNGVVVGYSMGGSGLGYDNAITEDQISLAMVGDQAYIMEYSGGVLFSQMAIPGPFGTTCYQAKFASGNSLLFLRWSDNSVHILKRMATGPPYAPASVIPLPASLFHIQVVLQTTYTLLAFHSGSSNFHRYQSFDNYVSFTLTGSFTPSSDPIIKASASLDSRYLATATANSIHLYVQSASTFVLSQSLTPAQTLLASNCKLRFKPDSSMLAVHSSFFLQIYHETGGLFQLLQALNSVPVSAMLFCPTRIQLYRTNQRLNVVLCSPLFEFLQSCVATCPQGYRPQAALNRCTQCLYDQQLASCVTSCRATFFAGLNLYCEPCVLPCLTCTSRTTCLEVLCPRFKDGLTCVQNCNYPKANDVFSGTCVPCLNYYLTATHLCYQTCPPGTYPAAVFCTDCGPPCLLCTAVSCISCLPPFFLHMSACLISCPPGTKPNYLSQCVSCPSNCISCATACLQCSTGFYLLQGNCLDRCPELYFDLQNVCLSTQTESITLLQVSLQGFMFPSSDKSILLSFSHPVTLLDFIIKFVVAGEFTPLEYNKTVVKLVHRCAGQTTLRANVTLKSSPSQARSLSGRPFSKQLNNFYSYHDYGCMPQQNRLQQLLRGGQALVNTVYKASPLIRSSFALILPAQWSVVLGALQTDCPTPALLLFLQNLAASPFRDKMRTWHKGRLLVQEQQPLRAILFTGLAFSCSAAGLLLGYCSCMPPAVATLLQLLFERLVQMVYFALIIQTATASNSVSLGVSIFGLVICLLSISRRLFRKVLFLNSSIRDEQFWQVYPEFAAWTLLHRFRTLVIKKFTITSLLGPELYHSLTLALKSSLLVAFILLKKHLISILIILVFIFIISVLLLCKSDPYRSRQVLILYGAKDCLLYLTFLSAATMQLAFDKSVEMYQALGWSTSALLLLFFLFQSALSVFSYLLLLSTAHRTQTTNKVRQYYQMLIAEGLADEEQINRFIINADLNKFNRQDLPEVPIAVCILTLGPEGGQAVVVQEARMNPLWEFYQGVVNFKVTKKQKFKTSHEYWKQARAYVTKLVGPFEQAELSLCSRIAQNSYHPEALIDIPPPSFFNVALTNPRRVYRGMKIPAVLAKQRIEDSRFK